MEIIFEESKVKIYFHNSKSNLKERVSCFGESFDAGGHSFLTCHWEGTFLLLGPDGITVSGESDILEQGHLKVTSDSWVGGKLVLNCVFGESFFDQFDELDAMGSVTSSSTVLNLDERGGTFH